VRDYSKPNQRSVRDKSKKCETNQRSVRDKSKKCETNQRSVRQIKEEVSEVALV